MNLNKQEDSKGLPQPIENVLKELHKLHPPGRQIVTSENIQGSPEEINQVVFESMNQTEKKPRRKTDARIEWTQWSGRCKISTNGLLGQIQTSKWKLLQHSVRKCHKKMLLRSWPGGTYTWDLYRMQNYCIGPRRCQTDWLRRSPTMSIRVKQFRSLWKRMCAKQLASGKPVVDRKVALKLLSTRPKQIMVYLQPNACFR